MSLNESCYVGIDMMFLHRIVLLRVLGHQLRMGGGVEAETSRKASREAYARLHELVGRALRHAQAVGR